MTPLTIHLFGGLNIQQDGSPIPKLVSRKAVVLLAYLAYEPRPHSREALATLFWDDRPQKQALSNLRTLIASLRKQAEPFVTISRQTLVIEDEVWVDTAVFQQQLATAQENWPNPASVTQMEQALTLYVGDFLAGVLVSDGNELEEWIQFSREQLRQQAIDARQDLIVYYLQQGEYNNGLRHAAILLEMDPWNEEAHRQMMQLLARSGQRQAALAQYETCVKLLDEELGIPPEPETTELYERIQTAVTTPTVNLPAIATTFVGRERELSLCLDQLRDPACRMLTIVGLGGMGKTRLGLQVAAALQTDFLNGVFFVPLAAVTSPEGVATAVAETLPTAFHDKVSTETQLLNYLRGKEVLLVLDNFEHLLAGTRLLTKILHQAPAVTLLITSRVRLDLQAEWLLELDGLPYPEEATAVAKPEQYAAIHLFEQRARVIAPDFALSAENLPSINRICQIVHGIPLGIELAAAWIRFLPIAELVQQIEQSLDLLATTMRDVPERQRSLTAVFDYVWSLLNEDEQLVFAQLSVFRGSFDLAAFRAITEGSSWTLAALVEKSLLHKEANGRYSLIEALRLYATTKLAASPDLQAQTQAQHSHYYADLLHQQEAPLKSRMTQAALNFIQQNLDNIHTAWTYAVTTHRMADLALAQESLALFHIYRGLYQEGEALLATAVDQLAPLLQDNSNPDEPRVLAHLYNSSAKLAHKMGKFDQAITAAQKTIQLAAQEPPFFDLMAQGYRLWGDALWRQGNYPEAVAHLETGLSLAQKANARSAAAYCLNGLGVVAWRQGKYTQAVSYYEQARAIFQEIGNLRGEGMSLNNLGVISGSLEDYESAAIYFEKALTMMRQVGDRQAEGSGLDNLSVIFNYRGNYGQAIAYNERSLAIRREVGDRSGEAIGLMNLGEIAMKQGDYARSITCYEQSLAIRRELGDQEGVGMTLSNLSLVYYQIVQPQKTHYYSQQAVELARQIEAPSILGYALTHLGHALMDLGQPVAAQTAYEEAYTLRREANQTNMSMEPLAGLAWAALEQHDLISALEYVTIILNYLDANKLDGSVLHPFLVHLRCVEVLQAANDPRVELVLPRAQALLQEQASKIPEGKMREMFLAVSVHATLLTYGEEDK